MVGRLAQTETQPLIPKPPAQPLKTARRYPEIQLPLGLSVCPVPCATNALTRNSGLLLDGEWRDGPAGNPVPAIWKQGMAVAHQVFTRFRIGDRDAHLNPHYARVG